MNIASGKAHRPTSEGEWIEKAISATDQQSADEELKRERDKAKAALEVFGPLCGCVCRVSQTLGPQTREHWQERLSYDFEDGEAPLPPMRVICSVLDQVRTASKAARWPRRKRSVNCSIRITLR